MLLQAEPQGMTDDGLPLDDPDEISLKRRRNQPAIRT
jgi:hypothetical protein